jgi:hypothetical protein
LLQGIDQCGQGYYDRPEMEAFFTSLHGGTAIRSKLLELVEEASRLAGSHRVDVHIMAFSFTDDCLAEALLRAAKHHARLTIRLLADWSQRTLERGQQPGRLAAAGLSNVTVRYTIDQPYVWDAEAGHMRWSYHASRGLLHHKTLAVMVDARPWKLACGSLNWTANAANSYENLLVLCADDSGSGTIAARMEQEFEALWSEGTVSLSVAEAHDHYQAILACYLQEPTLPAWEVIGVDRGCGTPIEQLTGEPVDVANAEIAFSSRPAMGSRREAGVAPGNRDRRMMLRSPSGGKRLVSVSITNLALDALSQTGQGELLQIAAYGLSPRVPEYGALLDAARRGARLCILLNRASGRDTAARLMAMSARGLPIEVRTVGRMMHHKYMVWPEKGRVITGTANFSTDASARHWEHRLRISENHKLADQFSADFDLIWSRVEGRRQVTLSPPSNERSTEENSVAS